MKPKTKKILFTTSCTTEHGRHLGFVVIRNSPIRSVDPEIPTLEPTKYEVYRVTRCGDMTIRVFLGHMEPPFGARGGRGGQRWHRSKRRWWFPIGCPL